MKDKNKDTGMTESNDTCKSSNSVKGRSRAMTINEVISLINEITSEGITKGETINDEASEEFKFDYQFTRSVANKTHQLTIFNLDEFAQTIMIEIKPR